MPPDLPTRPSLDDAQRFLRWLSEERVPFAWQFLPLTPPDEHGSPYASPTPFAAWPALMASDTEAVMPDDAYWLNDWGLYAAIKDDHDGRPWFEWPAPLRDRHPEALAAYAQADAHVRAAAVSIGMGGDATTGHSAEYFPHRGSCRCSFRTILQMFGPIEGCSNSTMRACPRWSLACHRITSRRRAKVGDGALRLGRPPSRGMALVEGTHETHASLV